MSLFNSAPDCRPKTDFDLYSYTVRYDDGAAPNPFRGMCTLAICKPGIRRTARPGDWVVGLGSARYKKRDHIVYAMQIERVLSWREYNHQAVDGWPHRLPDMHSPDLTLRLGDCLYYSIDTNIEQRPGVHSGGSEVQRQKQMAKDLNGHVLLASRFLYFGSSEQPLSSSDHDLKGLVVTGGQGYKRQANNFLRSDFIDWYKKLENQLGNGQHGWPRLLVKGQCAQCIDHDVGEEQDIEQLAAS